MKKPMASQYYDQMFNQVEDYQAHYRDSRYYVLWTQVIQFLRQVPSPKILEIGCGPGQFANYLYDQGFRDYHGFDFSHEAVRIARQVVPQMSFEVGDATKQESYRHEYNAAVVLEVLEHVEDDLGVLVNLKPGTVVIFSLPTFDDEAHVRWFTSKQEIVDRYNRWIDLRQLLLLDRWFVGVGLVRALSAPVPCDSFDLLGRIQKRMLQPK